MSDWEKYANKQGMKSGDAYEYLFKKHGHVVMNG